MFGTSCQFATRWVLLKVHRERHSKVKIVVTWQLTTRTYSPILPCSSCWILSRCNELLRVFNCLLWVNFHFHKLCSAWNVTHPSFYTCRHFIFGWNNTATCKLTSLYFIPFVMGGAWQISREALNYSTLWWEGMSEPLQHCCSNGSSNVVPINVKISIGYLMYRSWYVSCMDFLKLYQWYISYRFSETTSDVIW